MKKTISILLCILMMFSVFPAAVLADEELPDRERMPIIFEQPENIRIAADYAAVKNTGIDAVVPAGDDVIYRLFYVDTAIGEETVVYEKNSVGQVLGSYAEGEYYFEVINKNYPEYSVKSERFTLEKHEPTIFDKVEQKIGELAAGTLILTAYTPLGFFTVIPAALVTMIKNAINNMIRQWKIAGLR